MLPPHMISTPRQLLSPPDGRTRRCGGSPAATTGAPAAATRCGNIATNSAIGRNKPLRSVLDQEVRWQNREQRRRRSPRSRDARASQNHVAGHDMTRWYALAYALAVALPAAPAAAAAGVEAKVHYCVDEARQPQPGELQRDLHSRFDAFYNPAPV
jgi:hypothetical protein